MFNIKVYNFFRAQRTSWRIFAILPLDSFAFKVTAWIMYSVLVVTEKNTDNRISLVVKDNGITCFYKNYTELISKGKSKLNAHVVLLDMSSLDNGTAIEMARHCREIKLPVMVIIPSEHFEHYDSQIRPDDFVIHPFRPGELLARINVLYKLTTEHAGAK